MAQANFHQNQRVFVKPVGTWAMVKKVIPHWVKGLDEPLKVSYDLGLGRSFSGEELEPEKRDEVSEGSGVLDHWRVLRARNQRSCVGEGDHHPFPGTHPLVVTDEKDWGGWRVPAAEYDRNPDRFEFQARLIASAPKLMELTKALARLGKDPDKADNDTITALVPLANALLSHIYETQDSRSVAGSTVSALSSEQAGDQDKPIQKKTG